MKKIIFNVFTIACVSATAVASSHNIQFKMHTSTQVFNDTIPSSQSQNDGNGSGQNINLTDSSNAGLSTSGTGNNQNSTRYVPKSKMKSSNKKYSGNRMVRRKTDSTSTTVPPR